jgi:hypothetical protein
MLVSGILAEGDASAKATDLRLKLMNLGYAVAYLVAASDRALRLVEQSRPEQTLTSASTGTNGPGGVPSVTDAQVGMLSNDAGARPEPEGSRVVWQKSHDSLFASVGSRLAGVQYNLIVERLPSRRAWDWAVWRSGDRPAATLHGRTSSVASAMAAAEAAAREKRDMESQPRRLAQG